MRRFQGRTPRHGVVARGAFAGLGLILAFATVAALPAGVPPAVAAAPPLITASPTLKPPFDPGVTDYTARCGKSSTATTVVTLRVHAPAGTKVSIAGSAPRSGAFSVNVWRAWDQSFPFAVVKGNAAPVTYYVRCRAKDEAAVGAIRTRKSTAGYYLMSAHGSIDFSQATGGISTDYLDVVDNDGVPVWWFDSGTQIGEAQALPNGNLAWIPVGRPLEERRLDGTLVATAQLPDAATPDAAAPDLHDFALLPNGDWLLTGYPRVSGVDLSSIGGAANTCIIDAEVEEVTPAGAQVWSWFASDHISPTEINPNVQPTALQSTCAFPRDIWHMNSVQSLGGDFLVSLRQTDAVWRINAATGNVVWKLGGTPDAKSLTIVGDPLMGPIGQHDARMWSDGTVSMFDNGDDSYQPPGRRRARVVRYAIDTTANTATMVEEVVDPLVPNALGSACCGSARRLPDGHWSIGYGSQGINTEVTASGSRVLSVNYGDPSMSSSNPEPRLFSYRMDPVLPGVLSRTALRLGMDAMHPVSDARAPTLMAAGNGCSVALHNGWCHGTQTASFDAFDNVELARALCGTTTPVPACRFSVRATKDGASVKISSGRICDATRHCVTQAVVVGPFHVDRTPPRIAASATTADGKPYKAGTATNQRVTVHFVCSDATSGLAAHGCPADITVSHPNGQSVKGVAADKAGNTATVKFVVG